MSSLSYFSLGNPTGTPLSCSVFSMDSSPKKKAKYLMISDEVVSSEKVFVETMEVCLLVWVRPLQEVRKEGE